MADTEKRNDKESQEPSPSWGEPIFFSDEQVIHWRELPDLPAEQSR